MAIGRPRTCECGECKKCIRRGRQRERYQAMSVEQRQAIVAARDKERERERDRVRNKTTKRVEHLARNTARWRKEHPEAARAQGRVAYAIRTGKLVKQPCETCGAEKVHAHHDDHGKPLDVRWLCPLHHAAERQK